MICGVSCYVSFGLVMILHPYIGKIQLNEEHDPDNNISKHFNLPNHSTEDMSILGLLFAPNH